MAQCTKTLKDFHSREMVERAELWRKRAELRAGTFFPRWNLAVGKCIKTKEECDELILSVKNLYQNIFGPGNVARDFQKSDETLKKMQDRIEEAEAKKRAVEEVLEGGRWKKALEMMTFLCPSLRRKEGSKSFQF